MAKSSIEVYLSGEEIVSRARAAGFCTAGILNGGELGAHGRLSGAAALLVVALPYGNVSVPGRAASVRRDPPAAADGAAGPTDGHPAPVFGRIAPFARRNYYAEAVFRLQDLAKGLRKDYGGRKADYRILCNSPIPEKPPAAAAGVGRVGRNSLVITAEAGSLAVLAALTLPAAVRFREPSPPPEETGPFSVCRCCLTAEGRPEPACAAACPTGALPGDGTLIREKCIQWYASGNGAAVPGEVAAVWGDRFYGCTACQDACPHNRRPIAGADTARGVLDEKVDVRSLLALGDEALIDLFKGTALGLSWLGPSALRRNAELVLAAFRKAGEG